MNLPMSPRALADATGDRAAIGEHAAAPCPWPERRPVHLTADDDDAWPLRAARRALNALRRLDLLVWGEADTPLIRLLDVLAIFSIPISAALILAAFLL